MSPSPQGLLGKPAVSTLAGWRSAGAVKEFVVIRVDASCRFDVTCDVCEETLAGAEEVAVDRRPAIHALMEGGLAVKPEAKWDLHHPECTPKTWETRHCVSWASSRGTLVVLAGGLTLWNLAQRMGWVEELLRRIGAAVQRRVLARWPGAAISVL
jgi:hypothetical protein